jgi:molybdopterin-guanine dinucleotide biosynthesis protein MobB
MGVPVRLVGMKRVHILGRKNHGKTTLLVELVEHLSAQGLRVGTIKHTHHAHELDTPGKDSHLHRQAGASVSGILSRGMSAVFWSPDSDAGDRYDEFAPHFASCDVVLVEGDVQATAPKVEVWRAAVAEGLPMAAENPGILAVITDDAVNVSAPVWPRSDVPAIARGILELPTE